MVLLLAWDSCEHVNLVEGLRTIKEAVNFSAACKITCVFCRHTLQYNCHHSYGP